VIAYAVAQLFLFPLAELDPSFWILAGVAWAVDRATATATVPTDPQIHRWSRVGAAIGIALTVVALVAGSLDVAADRLAARALEDSDHDRSVEDARRAAALRPEVVRYRLLLAAARTRTVTVANIDAALADTDRALDLSPRDPIALRQHAVYVDLRADVTGSAADAQLAVDAWRDVMVHMPRCEPCRSALERAVDRAHERSGPDGT
jgi:hypothetical protein